MQIFDNIAGYIAGISSSQMAALVVCILAVSFAVTAAKKALSIVSSVVGLLAALHFFAPELYTVVYGWLVQGVSLIPGLFA